MAVQTFEVVDTRTDAEKRRNRAILQQIVDEDRAVLDALAKA